MNKVKEFGLLFGLFLIAMVGSFYILKYLNGADEQRKLNVKPTVKIVETKSFLEEESSSMVVFATDWCPVCKKAKKYFNDKNMDYKLIDIEKDQGGMQKFQALGGTYVPYIIMDGKIIEGFNEFYAEELYSEK